MSSAISTRSPAVPAERRTVWVKVDVFGLAGDFDSDAGGAVFDDVGGNGVIGEGAWGGLLLIELHVPGGVFLGGVVGDGEADGGAEELFVQGLVEDAGDVAVGVEFDEVAGIFEGVGGDFEVCGGCG